jgi:hypothetical protein
VRPREREERKEKGKEGRKRENKNFAQSITVHFSFLNNKSILFFKIFSMYK